MLTRSTKVQHEEYDVLAALAAAAGLAFAAPAQASIASGLPKTETLLTLQQQVGQNSDEALSQMIHLAKAGGHDRAAQGGKSGKGDKGNKGAKGTKAEKTDKGKHTGWDKGKGHSHHGKGKGKGHGNHNHPS